MKKPPQKLAAFALLEVAIALSVLGIIAYMTMPLLTKLQRWQGGRTTHEHQVQIMQALGGYVLANKRLPCPASSSNGEAMKVCDASTKAGYVPYKTLGISDKTAKDGNHHWMTYVVEPSLASNRITYVQPPQEVEIDPDMIFCKVSADGNISLLDERGKACVTGVDFLAVLLISHGNSGGYVLDNGMIHPVESTDSDKINNAKRSDTYTTKTLRLSGSDIFDDSILFASRNNLMSQWAKFPCYP